MSTLCIIKLGGLFNLNRYTEALTYSDELLEIYHSFAGAFYNGVSAYADIKGKKLALESFKRAIELESSLRDEAGKEESFQFLLVDAEFIWITR